MTPGQRVIGYVRVSTEGQGLNGAGGLEAQRQAIQDECARRRWELLRIEQDVLSGRTTNWPGLEAALGAVRSGKATGIVVAKLDRLYRSVVDFGRLFREATDTGWNIVSVDYGLDLTTPQGKLVANVLISVAEWERNIISQRTREGLATKRAQGVRLGTPPTIGPELAARIRTMRQDGMTLQAIANTLAAEGLPPPRGTEWRPSSLQAVLRGGKPPRQRRRE